MAAITGMELLRCQRKTAHHVRKAEGRAFAGLQVPDRLTFALRQCIDAPDNSPGQHESVTPTSITGRSMAWKRNQLDIVRLSITLLHVEPRVARRMDVPAHTHLDDLHLYIQAAMGWGNCHLWEFMARRYGDVANWYREDYESELDATSS